MNVIQRIIRKVSRWSEKPTENTINPMNRMIEKGSRLAERTGSSIGRKQSERAIRRDNIRINDAARYAQARIDYSRVQVQNNRDIALRSAEMNRERAEAYQQKDQKTKLNEFKKDLARMLEKLALLKQNFDKGLILSAQDQNLIMLLSSKICIAINQIGIPRGHEIITIITTLRTELDKGLNGRNIDKVIELTSGAIESTKKLG